MKLVSGEQLSWDDKQGYSKKILLNETILHAPGNLVQLIKIVPWETAKSHYHKLQTEIFYFLDNKWYWIINGEKLRPQAGEVLLIEPNDVHSVTNDALEDYCYLAFKINYHSDDFYWE